VSVPWVTTTPHTPGSSAAARAERAIWNACSAESR